MNLIIRKKKIFATLPALLILLFVMLISHAKILHASAIPTSAEVTYAVLQTGNLDTHTLSVLNTSPVPYDMYAFLFGQQYNVPITTPFPLENVTFVSAPPGWTPVLTSSSIAFQPSDLSVLIKSGESGTFVFTSTVDPPSSILFGACYSNNAGLFGFCSNGIATLSAFEVSPVPLPASFLLFGSGLSGLVLLRRKARLYSLFR